jgi:hypothetical protein
LAAGQDVPTVIEVYTEDVAWQTLKQALNREIDFENTVLSFERAKWARFDLVLEGEQFKQSLTPSSMKGLIDFQNAFYHSVGILLKNSPRIIQFTDKERESFELVFTVGPGSSDVTAEGQKGLFELGKELVGKMSGRQTFILALLIAILYFGNTTAISYIQGTVETKKIDRESERDKDLHDVIKQMSKDDVERMKILNDALKTSGKARAINEENEEALDSIVRNSAKADRIVIQGRSLNKGAIQSITRTTRRKSEMKSITGSYIVVGVDTSDPDVFRVRLQEDGMSESIINADLEDAVVYSRYHRVIQKAEWSRTPIRVTLSARIVGSEVQQAKIIKASTPKRSK